MATIQFLKDKTNGNIPDNAGVGASPKITPEKHREANTVIIDELKARGVLPAIIADLANLAGTETTQLFVSGYGLFKYVANGLVADNVTIFAAQGSGFWQLQKSFVPKKVAVLTPGVNVPVDLSNGDDVFKLDIDRDSVIGIPSGFKWHGKKIKFHITQTGVGGFKPVFNTNAGGYAFSFNQSQPDFTGQGTGVISWLEFEYSSDLNKWVLIQTFLDIQ